MPALEQLCLRRNRLGSVREFYGLHRQMPHLRSIDLRQNAILPDGVSRLRVQLEHSLPELTLIDGSPTARSPRASPNANFFETGLELSTVDVLAHATMVSSPLRIAYGGSTSEQLWCQKVKPKAEAGTDGIAPANTIGEVTSIYIMGSELPSPATKVPSFSGFTKLVWLNLKGNMLRDLPGLHACPMLEELCVADNLLSNIHFIAGDRGTSAGKLRRIDLSGNTITSIDGIERLTGLEELSIAQNSVDNLTPLAGLIELTMLNANDNSISLVWEGVFPLRTLPKLELLDISGCPMEVGRLDWRQFVIYHLDAIVVLNGEVVDSEEIKQAWQRFDGKLTTELLVRHASFSKPFSWFKSWILLFLFPSKKSAALIRCFEVG